MSKGLGSWLKWIQRIIRVGAGRRRKRRRPSRDWWFPRKARRAPTIAEQIEAAKEKQRRYEQAIARQQEAIQDKLRITLAEENIGELLSMEESARQAKRPKRGRAFFGLEMAKASKSGLREIGHENVIRKQAQRKVAAMLRAEDDAAIGQAAIRKQRLLNLEKAKIAKERKKKRAEEIKAKRLENLEKARKAKKRKRKKKKK